MKLITISPTPYEPSEVLLNGITTVGTRVEIPLNIAIMLSLPCISTSRGIFSLNLSTSSVFKSIVGVNNSSMPDLILSGIESTLSTMLSLTSVKPVAID